MEIVLYVILAIVAYLIGSVSSAVWISKRYYKIDIREHGSGNAGATNMLRVLGKKAAAPVFIIDFFKGYGAVSIAYFTNLEGDSFFILKLVLATLAVVGHMYPIYSNFKGGKGVATIAGALMGVAPMALSLSLGVFIVFFLLFGYVSLGSMMAGISLPLFIYLCYGDLYIKFYLGLAVAMLLIYTHRKNIIRLFKGEESKIYLSKRSKQRDIDRKSKISQS